MLLLPSAILVVVQMFLAVLLLRVYMHTKAKKQTALFVIISASFTLWTIVNTLLLIEPTGKDQVNIYNLLNSVGFFLGALCAVQIYNFSYFYPKHIQRSSKQMLLTWFFVFVSPLSMIEAVAGKHFYDAESGRVLYSYGSLRLYYVAALVFVLLLFAIRMSSMMRNHLLRVRQLKTMSLGIFLTALHGVVFIIFLPTVFNDETIFYAVGYLAPFYFVLSTSYGLIKQELFDFTTVAVRATLYIFSTVMLVVFYVAIMFVLGSVVSSRDFSISEVAINSTLALILVVTYQPIRKWFDKLTTKLFFQDSYDPQTLIDELNQALVADTEVDTLLKNVNKIMLRNLKASYVGFYVRQTSYAPYRFISSTGEAPTETDLDQIRQRMSILDKKVFSVNVTPASIDEKLLAELLRTNHTDVLCRLVNTTEYQVAGVGYFLIGPKKSGNTYSTNDLKVLEIIANELVIAVENALRFEEIQQFNVTLQKKIDDATRELKKTNDKLLALDEAKDEFVSMASHQLRTPLTSIKGYISMVLDGDAGKITETQKQMLGQALFSSQRMVYLISDLLNVSRLKTGKFVIEARPVYLPDLVESEMSQLYEGASAKNITLSFEKPKEFTTLNLDDMKIRQVVMNFTDNAIYYTPSGGKITVSLKDKKDSVEFRVKDTGIGVSKNEQHKLFTKFYRAENARKARPDGTGLGLFMAKKVIVAQGGSLIFESKEGKGSTFGFSFPKERLAVTPQQPTPEKA